MYLTVLQTKINKYVFGFALVNSATNKLEFQLINWLIDCFKSS